LALREVLEERPWAPRLPPEALPPGDPSGHTPCYRRLWPGAPPRTSPAPPRAATSATRTAGGRLPVRDLRPAPARAGGRGALTAVEFFRSLFGTLRLPSRAKLATLRDDRIQRAADPDATAPPEFGSSPPERCPAPASASPAAGPHRAPSATSPQALLLRLRPPPPRPTRSPGPTRATTAPPALDRSCAWSATASPRF